jgi:hypothetical protein
MSKSAETQKLNNPIITRDLFVKADDNRPPQIAPILMHDGPQNTASSTYLDC